jgi:hypothetical protein
VYAESNPPDDGNADTELNPPDNRNENTEPNRPNDGNENTESNPRGDGNEDTESASHENYYESPEFKILLDKFYDQPANSFIHPVRRFLLSLHLCFISLMVFLLDENDDFLKYGPWSCKASLLFSLLVLDGSVSLLPL